MPDYIYQLSVGISLLALFISILTAWFTFFHAGELKATHPTVVFFGPDGVRFEGDTNKVYLRTLLYSTSKKGHVIESMYVSLSRNESKQNFNVWTYGSKEKLERGSGLYVPQDGVAFDHHFLLPKDGANFEFLSGSYELKLYARIVGRTESSELLSIGLIVSDALAHKNSSGQAGIYFDWGSDNQKYHSHCIDKKSQNNQVEELALKIFEEIS